MGSTSGSSASGASPALNRLSVKVVRAKAARPSGPGSAKLGVDSAGAGLGAVRAVRSSVLLDMVAPLGWPHGAVVPITWSPYCPVSGSGYADPTHRTDTGPFGGCRTGRS